MHGRTGTIIGLAVAAIGLAGLGVALAQMMTHASANGALLSVGGLGVFLAACLFMLIAVR
jgi:hypothetical protein